MKAPRAKNVQVGDPLFGWTVVRRFEGHYPFLGNYVRFTLSDPNETEVEFWWRQRVDAPARYRPPGSEDPPGNPPTSDLRKPTNACG